MKLWQTPSHKDNKIEYFKIKYIFVYKIVIFNLKFIKNISLFY